MEGKLFSNLVYKTSRKQGGLFHVTFFDVSKGLNPRDGIFSVLKESLDRIIMIRPSVKYKMADIIAKYTKDIDVLIFVAPSRDETVYWLAQNRLVSTQVAVWAGSSSPGITGTIDYFVSADNMLGKEAYTLFEGQVVRLRGCGVYIPPLMYHMPSTVSPDAQPRYSYLNGSLILFARYTHVLIPVHSISIIHPSFDRVITNIIEKSQDVVVLLVDESNHQWAQAGIQRLASRIRSTVDLKNTRRLITVPSMPRAEFLSLTRASTLILDPVDINEGSSEQMYYTAFESLTIGTPVVTYEPLHANTSSILVNSVPSLLRSIELSPEIESLIAHSEAEIVDTALSITQNASKRKHITDYLRKVSKHVVQDTRTLRDWQIFLHRAGRGSQALRLAASETGGKGGRQKRKAWNLMKEKPIKADDYVAAFCRVVFILYFASCWCIFYLRFH
tara:strand:- start:1732 stop:3066 length:1335 start_codon:yes stop_codon:yes gene_type:complete